MALRFAFDDVESEIESFAQLAQSYLDSRGSNALKAWLTALQNLRTARQGVTHRWEIPTAMPIRTISNSNEGHPQRDGCLVGMLSTLWEITIPAGCPKISGGRSTVFHLAGIACTRVSLWRINADCSETEVARWSFEIGGDDSPGCHFHVQVKGDVGDRLFPPTLSIPRLPGMLVTPIDALDFLLGELFQRRWEQHLGKETHDLLQWSSIQRQRLTKVLAWQHQHAQRARGSVWFALKRAKPEIDQLAK